MNGIAVLERSQRPNPDKHVDCNRNSNLSYQRKLYANFDWLEIENLCFSKHVLYVVVRKSEGLKAKETNKIKHKFKMDGKKYETHIIYIIQKIQFFVFQVFSFFNFLFDFVATNQ